MHCPSVSCSRWLPRYGRGFRPKSRHAGTKSISILPAPERTFESRNLAVDASKNGGIPESLQHYLTENHGQVSNQFDAGGGLLAARQFRFRARRCGRRFSRPRGPGRSLRTLAFLTIVRRRTRVGRDLCGTPRRRDVDVASAPNRTGPRGAGAQVCVAAHESRAAHGSGKDSHTS